jgi:hypothetical protein
MKVRLLLTILTISATTVFSQNCETKDKLEYQDSLDLFSGFTFHLFCNKKIKFQKKLTSTNYQKANDRIDSVFYFLIPDNEHESMGDGEFISMHLHQASIAQQSSPKWFEIDQILNAGDHYKLKLTLYNLHGEKKTPLYIFKYRAYCNPSTGLYFLKRERIKKHGIKRIES